MLALLFSLIVLLSLGTSLGIFLEIIPATPGILAFITFVHIVFTWLFVRTYRRYHSLHRLVVEGQGELFSMAVSHLIGSSRFRQMRDHYRLRKCQGLVLSHLPLEALEAVEQFGEVRSGREYKLSALAAEIEANLQLGQRFWVDRALERTQDLSGADKHEGIRAVRARVKALDGHADAAAEELAPLTNVRAFPLTKAYRARNLLWYGEALAESGRVDAARSALQKAAKVAPHSPYGKSAKRRATLLGA